MTMILSSLTGALTLTKRRGPCLFDSRTAVCLHLTLTEAAGRIENYSQPTQDTHGPAPGVAPPDTAANVLKQIDGEKRQ